MAVSAKHQQQESITGAVAIAVAVAVAVAIARIYR